MIMIDIPMPERCKTCPCRRERDGMRGDRTACQAMEAAGRRYILVDDRRMTRPEDCPIRMGTLDRK